MGCKPSCCAAGASKKQRHLHVHRAQDEGWLGCPSDDLDNPQDAVRLKQIGTFLVKQTGALAKRVDSSFLPSFFLHVHWLGP